VDVTQSTAKLLELRRSLETGRLSTHEKDGRNVRIIMEDGSPYPLEGKLQFRDVTSVDTATGSYILRIVVPNPDYLLLPGMFVRAVVKEGADKQAILVPQEGVSRNTKGEAVAFIVDTDDVVREQKLTIDRAIGNRWLVVAGLSAGDRVIVEGRMKIRSGQKVNVVSSDAEGDARKVSKQSPNKHHSVAESEE
jgi:membrane fusion protein (multidrug efflux system)